MIQVTPPIDELVREDFPQSDVQMSLPQTSIIYTEPYSNAKYFIFIDFEMTLYIYDIGLYFRYTDFTINDQKKLTLTSKTSLFSPLYINSTARTCNNLIILKKG